MRARLWLWLCLPLLGGCASLYFHDAGEPPRPPPRHALGDLPYEEYWTGLVFNGSKIGFTHLRVEPVPGTPERYELSAQAVLHFHFLAIDKKVTLESTDVVHADLSIDRIRGDYDLDGNRLEVTGTMTPQGLDVTVETRDDVRREVLPVADKLYPASVIALYPIVHGLEIGRQYSYDVYDGETQSIATVTQEVLGYESSDLFEGRAFKIRTRLHGQEVTTWMSADGLPLLEISMGGVFIAGLESEETARRYLTRAALNKQESILDFSRVPAEPAIEQPRSVSGLTVALSGLDGFVLPSDDLQRCRREMHETTCEIVAVAPARTARDEAELRERYLRSTVAVPSRHAHIRELAGEIAGSAASPREQAAKLVRWIEDNVENVAVDSFSALDVLATRKAECQGNTYLYAAFARALDIPTRVVNGLVYSDSYGGGFFYHTWAESLLEGRWASVDPTFGQVDADATHVKILEGESLDQLAPMVGLMGRLRARILEVEHAQ
ncbi:MAG: transglutaminase-like domain-containing protein [Gammaproteobacteria bacterium]|nr:transglutaminase-like domain-containing protein [Gammaproteobacteria bacterium]